MSNMIVKTRVLSKIKHELSNVSDVNSELEHQGLKGTFNEYSFVSILKDLLPHGYSIGKGLIIDTKNSQSCESDVIVYDNTDISPLLSGPDTGIFPIECCRYVLEIKTKSSASEIKDAIGKASILKKMYSLTNRIPIFSYFAYSTDLKETREIDRYFENDKSYSTGSFIDTICIARHGYWYKRDSVVQNSHVNTAWLGIDTDGDYVEVLGFLSGILNTLNRTTPLGYYLLEPGFVRIVYINFFKLQIEVGLADAPKYNRYCEYKVVNDYANELLALRDLFPEGEARKRFLIAVANDPETEETRKMIYYKELESI